MVQAVKYKKPRKINVVSVSLALILGLIGYLLYQFLPLYLLKQEAYRVLEETGSAYAGRYSYYRANDERMESLRRKMEGQLREVGVRDPDLEAWIETDGPEVRFGCIFSVFLHWPFGILEDHEVVFDQEHLVVDRSR